MAKGKSTVGAFDIAPSAPSKKTSSKPKVDRGIKSIRLDNDLRRPLKMAAFDEGRSESDVINGLLRVYLVDKGYIAG